MKASNTSLKDRLATWTDWDLAAYHLGACLGFWTEFGAPPGHDPWHGVKGVMWSDNFLGEILQNFLYDLTEEGCLERREEPDTAYRWNKNYVGSADIMTTLSEDQ